MPALYSREDKPLWLYSGISLKRAIVALATILGIMVVLVVSVVRAQDIETNKHMMHELSGPFIVYRPQVQRELNLSATQQAELQKLQPDYVQETAQATQKFQKLDAAQRKQSMEALRQKSWERFWEQLKPILKASQFQRLRQLDLQHEGPAGLGRPEVVKALGITQDQIHQFAPVMQELQKRLEGLLQEASRTGKRDEVLTKAIQLRNEYQSKLEALLTNAQRMKWKAMVGEPADTLHE